MDSLKALAVFVRGRRKELDLTMDQLSAKSGVSKGLIGLLERANLKAPPKVDNLRKLAKGLGVADEVLLGLADAMPTRQPDATRPALTPLQESLLDVFQKLPPEELERELAYLRERLRRGPG